VATHPHSVSYSTFLPLFLILSEHTFISTLAQLLVMACLLHKIKQSGIKVIISHGEGFGIGSLSRLQCREIRERRRHGITHTCI